MEVSSEDLVRYFASRFNFKTMVSFKNLIWQFHSPLRFNLGCRYLELPANLS